MGHIVIGVTSQLRGFQNLMVRPIEVSTPAARVCCGAGFLELGRHRNVYDRLL